MIDIVQAAVWGRLTRAAAVVMAFVMVVGTAQNVLADRPMPTPVPALHSGDDLVIDAPAAVLMDVNTGIVLYDKNMHERHYPASMTKVMTALLVLEHFHDNLDARVPFSYEAVFSIPRHTSHIAMNDNETLSVLEALYAIMLPSANDVSNALAELVAGSMEDFALMMTARAIELGARNTRFANAHGLHDPEHFTTPYDMALIMRAAVQFPVFQEIISTEFTETSPTERQPLPRPLLNTNHMILSASRHFNPNIVGGKTGFTDEARHTLVSFGRMRNMELISVVMRQESALTYIDTTALMNFGFENFENVPVFDRNSYTREIPVMGQDNPVRAIGERSLTMSLPIGAREHLSEPHFDIPDYFEQPVVDGQQIGTATIMYGDIEISTIRMFAEVTSAFVPEVYTPVGIADSVSEGNTWFGYIAVAIQVLLVLVGALAALILVIHFKTRRARLRRFRSTRGQQMYYYRYK